MERIDYQVVEIFEQICANWKLAVRLNKFALKGLNPWEC